MHAARTVFIVKETVDILVSAQEEIELTLHRLTDGTEDKKSKGRGANGRLDFMLQVSAPSS